MQSTLAKIKGLYTHPNLLSEVPQGALVDATNIFINRDSVAEPRRGYKIYGNSMGASSTNIAHQLFTYKNRILRHYGAATGTTLEYDSTDAGTFLPFILSTTGDTTNTSTDITNISTTAGIDVGMPITGTGIPANTTVSSITNAHTIVISNAATATAVGVSLTLTYVFSEITAGTRLKSIEANGNFYCTTANGIKKISASTEANLAAGTYTVSNAGGVKALDAQAVVNYSPGFFTQDSAVSYRIVWGITDANTNEILGFPSEQIVITNPISTLLGRNLNSLLIVLDAQTLSGGIDAQTYVNNYKVSLNPLGQTISTNLQGLTTALDNDINAAYTITAAAVSGPVNGLYTVTATVSSDPTTFIFPSDYISVSGVTPSTYNSATDTYFPVTQVTATTIVYTTETDPGVYVASGTAKRQNYSAITKPRDLSTVPTTEQLEDVQRYYNDIVTYLQLEPVTIVADTTVFNTSNAQTSATVDLTITVPTGITTSHFYQVYRSDLAISTGVSTLSDTIPNDEEKLVYEANPTTTEINNREISLHDIVPDAFKGANLYTNQFSGDGIVQANEVPPLATDITQFKGYTFFSNTKTKHKLVVSLLSTLNFRTSGAITKITTGLGTFTSQAHGLSTGDVIVITGTDTTPCVDGRYEIVKFDANRFQLNGTLPTGIIHNITVAGTNGTWYKDSSSTLSIKDGTTTNTYTFVTPYQTFSVLSCDADVANSLNGKYFRLNSALDVNKYYIWYKTSGGAVSDPSASNPGRTGIRVNITTGFTAAQVATATYKAINQYADFQVSILSSTDVIISASEVGVSDGVIDGTTGFGTNTDPGETENATNKTILCSVLPTPAQQVEETARSLERIINKQSGEIVNCFYTSISTGVPGELTLEARSLSQVQFYLNANTALVGQEFNPTVPTSGATNASTNEVSPNRLYYSKYQQPEAVPILNYIEIGPKDKQILRIVPLRDSLIILKEEAIYRLTGLSAPFTVALSDSSTNLYATDTAQVLNNFIYMLSSQGVARVSDNAVEIISRPIENKLQALTTSAYSIAATASFGVAYESDRSYYLFTIELTSDTLPSVCYRYNAFTESWTNLDITKNCGIVNIKKDLLYLGATDLNYIEQERKAFDRTDYADREYGINVTLVNDDSVTLTSVANVDVDDVIVQTQYLTINQFNRKLLKLDNDFLLADSDYYSTLQAVPGDNLSSKLDTLITKVANDTGRLAQAGHTSAVTYTALTPVSSTFATMQTAYNSFVSLLNNDTGTGYKRYANSNGSIDLEIVITDVNINENEVTTFYSLPFIAGSATIFKHISTSLEWVPQTMQDPSLQKQVSEGTLFFESTAFTNAAVLYASDLSPEFEEQAFTGDGNGAFGAFTYGDGNYGGSGNGTPFRTYLPLEKQRCRYINCRFTHAGAREFFRLYGMSLTYTPTGTRAYR